MKQFILLINRGYHPGELKIKHIVFCDTLTEAEESLDKLWKNGDYNPNDGETYQCVDLRLVELKI